MEMTKEIITEVEGRSTWRHKKDFKTINRGSVIYKTISKRLTYMYLESKMRWEWVRKFFWRNSGWKLKSADNLLKTIYRFKELCESDYLH